MQSNASFSHTDLSLHSLIFEYEKIKLQAELNYGLLKYSLIVQPIIQIEQLQLRAQTGLLQPKTPLKQFKLWAEMGPSLVKLNFANRKS